jgi:hypothetical protein
VNRFKWFGTGSSVGLAVSRHEYEGRDCFLQFLFMSFPRNDSQHVGTVERDMYISQPVLKRNTRIKIVRSDI